MRTIKIFDTTLRDGEQALGCSMNPGEKIEVAKRLEKLSVDIIEADFPVSSHGEFEYVRAIAGDNTFAHEAGIHQYGVLANRKTYEIMTPESIGRTKSRIIPGKYSGRHAFEERLNELNINLDSETFEKVFEGFKYDE
ncbi:MAG: hypothetical protein FWC22_06785 [Treponema sp.]|nr:hypothetical protein [Treponema sp.]